MKGDAAESGGIPGGEVAPAKPDPAPRSASAPPASAQRDPSAANAGANAPLTLSPQSAPASDPSPPTRLAAANTVPTDPFCRRQSSGSGLLAEEGGRRAGLLPRAAKQVSGRPEVPSAGHQARRSRRQGGLLPHHGGPVRIRRRGCPVLRQFEKCRRAVRHPKELARNLSASPPGVTCAFQEAS